jgi:hypothetical protein
MDLEEVYKFLRKAEWNGQSLSGCITILENKFPELRETDAELEAPYAAGSKEGEA